jgi:hypothetical protein
LEDEFVVELKIEELFSVSSDRSLFTSTFRSWNFSFAFSKEFSLVEGNDDDSLREIAISALTRFNFNV